jgi:hypothetical protein
MTHQPPLDQRIVDEYFRLASSRKTKDIAWLYGMVATYGLKPEELIDLDWGSDLSISVPGKKRLVRPLHPQWVFLFGLKEKQPRNLQSCYSSLCSHLYEAMAFQDVQLNITDLVLAHKLRKNHYRQLKQQSTSYPAFAGVS